MTTGREIQGRVVLTATTDTAKAVADLKAAFKKLNPTVKVNAKFSVTQVRAALKEVGAKGASVKVDAKFSVVQVRKALKEATAGKTPTIRVNVDVRKGAIKNIVAESAGVQSAVTSAEQRELLKRETARANSATRTGDKIRGIEAKGIEDRATLAERANLGRINADNKLQNQLIRAQLESALRVERINAQLNARLTAQNNAFEQRRALAAEREQRRLERRVNKPLLQRILIDTNRLNSSLADFDKAITRGLRTSLLAFTVWSAAVAAAVTAASVAGVVAFAKLQDAAVRAGAVVATQLRVSELEKYGKALSDFGDTTARASREVQRESAKVALSTLFSPTEVAQGIQQLLQSGQKAEDAYKNIAAAADFASVNNTDLIETTKGLATSLAAAGLSADDSALLLDKITVTAAAAVGDVDDYFTAFSNGAGAAGRTIGATTDETLFFLRLLGQTGTLGLEAGTQVDIIFRDLGRSIVKARDEYAKYGVTVNSTASEQLVGLAEAIEKTGGNRVAQAKLRAELGLQEKSFRSLSRIIPQVQELGTTRAERLAAVSQIISSTSQNAEGVVGLQLNELRKNIAFQFDQLKDSAVIAFAAFGEGAAKAVTGLLDAFAGTDGLIDNSLSKVRGFGVEFGKIVARITAFVQTPAFIRGIKTFSEAIKVTLGGVADAFKAFSSAFNDGKQATSTFEAVADAILGFSQVSATVLPVVAGFLGEIFDFLIDNAGAFETFAKVTLSIYALRKVFVLVVNPLLNFAKVMGELRGSATFAGTAIGRLVPFFALITTAVVAGAGFIKGFVNELRNTTDVSPRAQESLRSVAEFAGLLVDALGFLTTAVFEAGEEIGGHFAKALVDTAVVFGEFLALFNGSDFDIKSFSGAVADAAQSVSRIVPNLSVMTAKLQQIEDESEGAGDGIANSFAAIGNAIDSVSEKVRGSGLSAVGNFASGAVSQLDAATDAANGLASALGRVGNAALAAAQAQGTAAQQKALFDSAVKSFVNVQQAQDAAGIFNTTPQKQLDLQNKAGVVQLDAARKRIADALKTSAGGGSGGSAGGGGGGEGGGGEAATFVDPDDAIRKQIDALKPARKAAETSAAIAKALAAGQKCYIGTRREVALLQDALPGLDKALETQRKQVETLDSALTDLRNTQLLGTKAFSDQTFALDQQAKTLQLQKLDLEIGGAVDGDPRLKAIDDQLKSIQQQSERTSLTESLQLDPLRRQLEATFNPTTEASFAAIVTQFKSLSAARATAQGQLDTATKTQEIVSAAAEAGAAKFTKLDDAAQKAASAISSVSTASSSAATSIGSYSDAVEEVPSGSGVVDKSLTKINERVTELEPRFRSSGSRVATLVTQGINRGAVATLYPALGTITTTMLTQLRSAEAPALLTGEKIMGGLKAGLVKGFGTADEVGSIAHFLNKVIPARIAELKGPVSYDATILVPAGQAIMGGLDQGLRTGFGGVESFLKGVAPLISETVPDSLFADRTKQFMVDVALGKAPDPNKVFGDLIPQELQGIGAFTGALDPTLGFLHQSQSYADTAEMSKHLAALFGLDISALRFDHSQLTTTGNVSDHFRGLAADFAVPGSSTPDPKKDALFAAIQPLLGKIFSQILYKTNVGGNHFNHVHAAFKAGKGFSVDSGKKGAPPVFDIPGAPPIVDQAISAAAQKFSLPVQLLAAIAKQESGFRPSVVSPDGGYGLFQLTSPGLKQQAGGKILDPFVNAEVGARYFKQLLQRFDGNTFKALAGYNGGPGAGDHPFAQVIKYANSVLSIFRSFGGGREKGGPLDPNKWHLVGERGPELLGPGNKGTVFSNRDSYRMMGGGMSYTDNSVTTVTTAASDPEAIAALADRRRRARMQKVTIR